MVRSPTSQEQLVMISFIALSLVEAYIGHWAASSVIKIWAIAVSIVWREHAIETGRLIMTNDELITVARTHTVDFPKLSGEPWANQETLTKVTVLDTVVVSFESDQHPKKIMILLERESGKFISSWLMPGSSK
jgi:hypothetical protein